MRIRLLPLAFAICCAGGLSPLVAQSDRPACAQDNAGLTLPAGFCALVFADNIGAARHLAVAPNGDVFAAVRQSRGSSAPPTDFVVLRDSDGDGVADVERRVGSSTGTGIRLVDGYVLFGTDAAILRYPWRAGALEPSGPPDTLVQGLPDCCGHAAKGFAVGLDGDLYVNVGSPSNACQQGRGRQQGVMGQDPCPQLETRAGTWRFAGDRLHQSQADGIHFATGLRNTFALAVHPQSGLLYGVQHGRDQLAQLWPDLYTEEQSAEKPGEEFVQISAGDDFGWPYCYYDPELQRKVLAPEYGGDRSAQGRCADKKAPLMALPAHWAPEALLFYTGSQFPRAYAGGAFVAFHGSWNRAPLPQGGFNVVFIPFRGNEPAGAYQVFADGFRSETAEGGGNHRPAGLAQGPDGSLYVSDDQGGRIYRIVYRGN